VRAALFGGPHRIEVGDRPDPVVEAPTDAVVRVVLGSVCGSDLWYYRGESPHAMGPIGHEFVGRGGTGRRRGARRRRGRPRHRPVHIQRWHVRALPRRSHVAVCRRGLLRKPRDRRRPGEAVRVPLAESTLVRVPGSRHPDETMRSLVTLSDVMCTGHHAAVSAGVGPDSVVAVVGDGAVGLCAVIAARRLGAARVIAFSRNPARQELAGSFGATDILAERGNAATEAVLERTDGVGVDAALECVGTGQSLGTALAIARPGSIVGVVGAPHGVDMPITETVVFRNIGLRGGVAPARTR
jgi:threonine dehydrogenase-like Zn-dependent dehydrogenase